MTMGAKSGSGSIVFFPVRAEDIAVAERSERGPDTLVERWFAALTQKQIKRGAHPSTRALEAAIRQYIAITNEAPTPFVWTKTADEILASVARFCHRISETGH